MAWPLNDFWGIKNGFILHWMRDVGQFDLVTFSGGSAEINGEHFSCLFPRRKQVRKLWKENSVFALNFVLCIMLKLELQNLFPSPSLSFLPFSMCNWEKFSTLSMCEIFSYIREYLYVTFF